MNPPTIVKAHSMLYTSVTSITQQVRRSITSIAALLAVPAYKARFLERVAELLETVFRWDNVEAHFDAVIAKLEPILPRHISRWKNMKLSNWKKNINATKYYARVRPKKIPELLQKAMKLTKEEVNIYFGHALEVLEETNAAK